MEKVISGGVYCKECNRCLSRRRKRKNFQPDSYIICDLCENDKISSCDFILEHFGDNVWHIKNHIGTWMGKNEWVNERSSYYQFTSNCEPTIFTWYEVKEFIKNKFNTILD